MRQPAHCGIEEETRTPVPNSWQLACWDTAPVLLDAISAHGAVLACNASHAAALGYTVDEVVGRSVDRFYLRSSAATLRELLRLEPGTVERGLRLELRRRDGKPLSVTASADTIVDGELRVLRLVKQPLDQTLEEVDQLVRENETLRSIVSTSRDALWCIEFAEPVDLTAPIDEAIRQFFENVSYWRLCNQAMARLYRLPEHLDFNEQHVRVAFPRNPQNEAFVRQLIEHDFNVDGAPSLDHRYDGLDLYVENDVRGYIENGRLHRMWGAARDLSEQKRKESDLASRLDAAVEVLSAVPDPILVIARDGVLEAANPAVEWRFGWPVDEVLGRPASNLVRFPDGFEVELAQPASGAGIQTLDVTVRAADGTSRICRAHLAALGGTSSGQRIILTLRSEPPRGVDGRRAPAPGPAG